MKRTRTALLVAVKVAVSASLLYLVFRKFGSGIGEQLRQVDVAIVLFALMPQFVATIAQALRWHTLALGLLTLLQAVRYTFVGAFYASLLPGGVSGDVAKGAALALTDRSTRTAVLPVSILADRLIGMYVLGVFFCAACGLMLWRPPGGSELLARMGAIGLGAGAPLVVLLPLATTALGNRIMHRLAASLFGQGRLRQAAHRMLEVLDTYRARSGVWLAALALSIVSHACFVVLYVIVLHALRLSLPVHLTIVMYAVMSMLYMIPISISGLGVREWFTAVYFPAVGLAASAGVAFSLTCVALSWLVAAFGGVWHLLDLLPARRAPARAS